MLRSLLQKKLLTYGNGALAIVLVVFVVVQFARLPAAGIRPDAGRGPADETPAIEVASVDTRPAYDAIAASQILGPDAAPAPKAKVAPVAAAAPKKEVITQLPLRLIGTVVSGEDDPFGSAIIANTSGVAAKKTYFVGDAVMPQILLKSIRRRMVILDNKPANRLEQLLLEESELHGTNGPRQAARSKADVVAERTDLASRIRESRPAVQGANRIFTFDRQELIAELEAKYDELASNVDVQVVKDANGEVQGVQASNVSGTPFAGKFGIEEGDIVQSVNGQRVDSLDRVYDIVESSRNATTFRVQLLRGGQPQVFTYHLR